MNISATDGGISSTAPLASTITVNSASVDRTPPNTGLIFHAPLTGNNANPNAPVWLTAAVTDGTTTQTRHTWLSEASTAPAYDDDANLTNDGQWSYLWDAENRLVEMEINPAAVQVGRPYRRLTFAYDWTGRRLARTGYGPNATTLSATRWWYDGWNPVAEFSDQTTGQTLVHTYLWGMDMSGTMQGAGGVGGLLAVHIHNPRSTIYHPSYDGNGNIVAWTASGSTAPASLREYDSFGNILIEHGTPPCAIGFSTKIEDPETGLLYYGYRYLSPPLGRWLSQDPIHERGGVNLYEFVRNDGVVAIDFLGMSEVAPARAKDVDIWASTLEQAKQLLGKNDKGDLTAMGATWVLANCGYRIDIKTVEGVEKCCVRYVGFAYFFRIVVVTNKVLGELGHDTKKDFEAWTKNEIAMRELSNGDFYHNGGRVPIATARGIRVHEEKHREQYLRLITKELLKQQDKEFEEESEKAYNNQGKCWYSLNIAQSVLKLANEENPRTPNAFIRAFKEQNKVNDKQISSGFRPGNEGEDEAVEAERAYYRSIRSQVARGGDLSRL